MTAPIVFVIKNQAGQFLNKHSEWVDGADAAALYRTAHRDEAVNTVFEVSSKDIYLRAEAIACGVDAKGQPLLGETIAVSRDDEPENADSEVRAATESAEI